MMKWWTSGDRLVQRGARETLNMSVLGSKLSPITIVLISVLLSGKLFVGVTGQCGSLCSPPFIFGDGTPSFSPDQECYDGGSNVNVTCSGYLFGVTEIGECVQASFGYWATDPLPTCEESSCPLPTAPGNGLVSPVNHNSLYDEIVYSCDDGLFLDGPGMAVCIGTGQWSPSTVPTCSGNCTIPVITNGEATSSDDVLQEGSQMTISCSEGYTLTGVADFRCHNEEWNPDVGECLANCPSPDIANSDFARTNQWETDHGDFIIVTVTCDDGFTSGTGDNVSEPLTCGNGSWDVDIYCYSNCPSISAPDDGHANSLVEPFYHGRIVAFNCSLGFTLVGDSSSTCDDGNWLNAVPECKAEVPSGSIATIVGIAVGAILVIVIVIISIFIFYKRRSDESATNESKGKESDSSPQYENSVFDQSKTDVHTYEDLNTDAQNYDDTADPHIYQDLKKPDQEANYEDIVLMC